jgi:hypothetical protein
VAVSIRPTLDHDVTATYARKKTPRAASGVARGQSLTSSDVYTTPPVTVISALRIATDRGRSGRSPAHPVSWSSPDSTSVHPEALLVLTGSSRLK